MGAMSYPLDAPGLKTILNVFTGPTAKYVLVYDYVDVGFIKYECDVA